MPDHNRASMTTDIWNESIVASLCSLIVQPEWNYSISAGISCGEWSLFSTFLRHLFIDINKYILEHQKWRENIIHSEQFKTIHVQQQWQSIVS